MSLTESVPIGLFWGHCSSCSQMFCQWKQSSQWPSWLGLQCSTKQQEFWINAVVVSWSPGHMWDGFSWFHPFTGRFPSTTMYRSPSDKWNILKSLTKFPMQGRKGSMSWIRTYNHRIGEFPGSLGCASSLTDWDTEAVRLIIFFCTWCNNKT